MDDLFVDSSVGSGEEETSSVHNPDVAESLQLPDEAPIEERVTPPQGRRSRKREAELYSSQLAHLRQEIADAKAHLATLSSNNADAHETALEVFEMTKRIDFLRTRLEAHDCWMDELRKLLATAPLMDYALRGGTLDVNSSPLISDDESKEDTASFNSIDAPSSLERELSLFDRWQHDATGNVFSSILIATRVNAAVKMSQTNARKLLDEFANPACAFAVQFETRGWSIAANLDTTLLTFRASRVIPGATVWNIASAIWQSIQYDDILRTFAPTVLEATTVFRSDTSRSSLVERTIQIEPTIAPKAIVMIDSMEDQSQDGFQCWQIALETCDDPCLIAYTGQTKLTESSPSQQLHPLTPRSSSNCLDVVMGVKCYQLGPSGVLVQLAGSVNHEGTGMIPIKSHVDLVQYLMNILPEYDDLQLLSRT